MHEKSNSGGQKTFLTRRPRQRFPFWAGDGDTRSRETNDLAPHYKRQKNGDAFGERLLNGTSIMHGLSDDALFVTPYVRIRLRKKMVRITTELFPPLVPSRQLLQLASSFSYVCDAIFTTSATSSGSSRSGGKEGRRDARRACLGIHQTTKCI